MTTPPRGEGAGREAPSRLPPYLRHPVAVPALTPDDPRTGPRPFVLTSGRVSGGDLDINVETQVTSNPAEAGRSGAGHLASELRAIVALCGQPMSVAEISARLRLHLGVTRILVGDLRAAGHLEIHAGHPDESHSPETILRVIRGLRAIT